MLSVLVAALLAAQPASATDKVPVGEATLPAPPAPAPATADCCLVKALTPVRLAITNPMNSNQVYPGQRFELTLREPILLDGGRSIPAGTTGEGEVVHAARTGLAGKPGELLLAARFLDVAGVRIPLRSMRVGGTGKDNLGLAIITAAAVGLIGYVISGGQVRVLAGAPADAKISADTRIDAARLAVPLPVPVSTISSTSEGNIQ